MNVPYDKVCAIIDKYGVNNQRCKAAEELAELQVLILQDANKTDKNSIAHITEEVADCYVMLKQIEAIYMIDDRDIQPIIDWKIERALREDRGVEWEEKAKAEANLQRG